MKIFMVVMVMVTLATGCARTPQTLSVTDLQGNYRPYYEEDEAIDIRLGWDYSRDAGKVFECLFANAFTGEVAWKGVAIAPEVEFGQKVARLDWSPPKPETGIRVKGGNYMCTCSFGNENAISIPVSVRAPFNVTTTDLEGNGRAYFANDEAIMLRVSWDEKYDADGSVECILLNSFNGETLWQGKTKIPSTIESRKISELDWQPKFPVNGISLKRGNYSATCNLNGEKTVVLPISVTNVKTWP